MIELNKEHPQGQGMDLTGGFVPLPRPSLLLLSRVQLFVTPWTVACKAPLSWDSPGKNTGVGCLFSPPWIFPTQGSNPCLLCLLHCRKILYPLSHQGSLGLGFS